MLFNSIHFLIFFPIIVLIYFLIPHRHRWILLLLGSYYFYMSWRVEYIFLILASTLVDYFAGWQIYKSENKKKRKAFLFLSIGVNLGFLFTFKYWNFFSESIRQTLGLISINLDPVTVKWLLPIGISFYTFQTLSYTIDIYRNKIKPEKHLGIFAVYVSFFPQLVAGPIERAKNLLPQFYKKHYFDYIRVTDGMKLMLWGFFKKIVIADNAAIIVDTVYNSPHDFTSIPFLLATFLFGIQIYCDFSGYSDIAIGAAQVLGFNLMDNFKRPYFSRSIAEFWRRWHISLSTWFKDYVYIPLGGNRVSIPRWYLNIFIVFLVSGLWHGANWTFVVWGGIHGALMVAGPAFFNIRTKITNLIKLNKIPKIHSLIQITITFLLVNFAWIFFRANSIQDAFYIVSNLFTDLSFNYGGSDLNTSKFALISLFGTIIFMEFVHLIQEHRSIRHFLSQKPIWLRWTVYITIIMLILLFGAFNEQEFIYFQF